MPVADGRSGVVVLCKVIEVADSRPEVNELALLEEELNGVRTAKFVNLDMEEYRDLDITCAAFTQTLEEPEFRTSEIFSRRSAGASTILARTQTHAFSNTPFQNRD